MYLNEPVVVSQAEPGVVKWGMWQFPSNIARMRDGGIALQYSVGQDTVAGYKSAFAVSYDQGDSWREVEHFPSPAGLLLKNGDILRPKTILGLNTDWIELTPYDRRWRWVFVEYDLYLTDDIPHLLRGIRLERCVPGSNTFIMERHRVNTPGEYMVVTRDLSHHPYGTDGDFLNAQFCHRLRLAPDGSVWMLTYQNMKREGDPLYASSFHVSNDNGKTFEYRSHIAHDESFELPPEKWIYPGEVYEGFCEPDIAFMPDGSIICIMRNGGKLPMFIMRSTDDGYNWSRPVPFDDFGVIPGIAQLENGATVVVYGRPGVHVRATDDPQGLGWGDRLSIISTERSSPLYGGSSCGNCGIMALDSDTVLVTYSDFEYPNPDGVLVKTILAQKIHTKTSVNL